MNESPKTPVWWPMNKWLSYASWVVGACYGGWIGHLLGTGWATLAILPLTAMFAAMVWMASAMVLVKLGLALQERIPLWLAIATQLLLLPVLIALLFIWYGGSGPDGPGRYPTP